MKLFRILIVLGLVFLLAIACTEKSPTTVGQTDQTESQAAPADQSASAQAEPTEINGMLTQTENGLAIVTDTETFIVAGQDLSSMVGQKVKVTGAIAEGDAGQVIEVMTVEPIQ